MNTPINAFMETSLRDKNLSSETRRNSFGRSTYIQAKYVYKYIRKTETKCRISLLWNYTTDK